MELYLRYLKIWDARRRKPTDWAFALQRQNQEHIELLQLNKGNIRRAEYITETVPKKELMIKLHNSIEVARKRLDYEADDK